MVSNIPGFTISGDDSDERGFGQARQNVLINGRRVSGKSNDAATALGRITAESVLRIEIVDGATLDIPGLSGQVANVIAKVDAFSGNWNWQPEFRENLQPSWYRGSLTANGKTENGWSWSAEVNAFEFHNGHDGPGVITDGVGNVTDIRREGFNGAGEEPALAATLTYEIGWRLDRQPEPGAALLQFRRPGGLLPQSGERPAAVPLRRSSARTSCGGEIGADYEFDFGPGRLKLIGLQRSEEGDDLVTVESYDAGGAALDGRARAGTCGGWRKHPARRVRVRRLRRRYAVGSWKAPSTSSTSPPISASARPTEAMPLRRCPAETPAWRSGGRRPTSRIAARCRMPGACRAHWAASIPSSSQIGRGGLTREFVRPKGFLALVWKANEDARHQPQGRAARRAARLRRFPVLGRHPGQQPVGRQCRARAGAVLDPVVRNQPEARAVGRGEAGRRV